MSLPPSTPRARTAEQCTSFQRFRSSVATALLALSAVLTASAQSAPKLISVTPADSSTNAAPRGAVTFEFDQEMDITTPLQLSVPNIVVGNFDFSPTTVRNIMNPSWGSTRRTLKFQPSGPIALNTAVGWTLNPAGVTTPIKSAAGVALATTTGTYKIANNSGGNPVETCPPPSPALGAYTLSKQLQYSQTSSADPVVAAGSPGVFVISVQSPSAGPAVTGGSVTFPGGSSKTLALQVGVFRLPETYPSQAALDAARPAGNYLLHFTQTGVPERVIPMALPAMPTLVPKVANYADAQVIDATKDFTLQWNAFSPRPANSVVRLVIVDEFANRIFLAPNSCVPRTLDPAGTSIVIPANYLRPGFRYQGVLVFGFNFYSSTTDVAGMTGTGVVQLSTSFTLQAKAGPDALPNETCPSGTPTLGAVNMTKFLNYHQTSAADVIPQVPGFALFGSTLISPPAGPTVTGGSLTLPVGAVQVHTNHAGAFVLSGNYSTAAAIEAAFPAGNYIVGYDQAGQPERNIPMTMPALPTSIPQIANYAEAQAIDASKDFTLKWTAFSPQGPGAFIRVIIVDERGTLVFMAPNPCVPRTLDPTAISVVIPARYFGPGVSYHGTLQFGLEFYSANDDVQMYGYGAVQRSTSFELKAAGDVTGRIDPARFTSFHVLANGHPQFHLTGTAEKAYAIQRAGRVLGGSWSPVGSVNMDASGNGDFEDTDAALTSPAFYRAVGN